jgi:hypothetical protein
MWKQASLRTLVLAAVAVLVAACATSQSRYFMLDKAYPPKPEGYEVQVYREGVPDRPFERISRLDVHLEKTHFIGSSLEDAMPQLKQQARLSGADAIVEIRESTSMVGETRIYHVTATGIRFTEAP